MGTKMEQIDTLRLLYRIVISWMETLAWCIFKALLVICQ